MLDYLVVTAHPDDECAVAGLLLQARSAGLKTGLICLTKGESGGFAEKETRVKELAAAVEILGLEYFRHLDFPDAGIEFNTQGVEILVPLLQETRARVILTIHPDDYHPDHKAVSYLVDRAVFVAGLKKSSEAGQTWHPNQVLYFSLDFRTNARRPDIIFDITGFIDTKRKVMEAHASQEVASVLEAMARSMGMLGGFAYGEGLYIGQPLRLASAECLLNSSKIGR